MGLFTKLGLALNSNIDWEMTPDYTFGTFESWGGKERVRSAKERIYYFFIDNWGETPKLCLMERGIKHARVVAEIIAPVELVRRCVAQQGEAAIFEQSYAIDDALQQWLLTNVIETDDDSKIIPLVAEEEQKTVGTGLPLKGRLPAGRRIPLPAEGSEMQEKDVADLTRKGNFFDAERNPNGEFSVTLVDNNDGLTVSDLNTGLMWQREGLDIMSNRMLRHAVKRLNSEGFAGYSDWRIPTMAEALTLMASEKNGHGQHLHPCFSPRQPFIFVAASRIPGGYWFVDYKQGRSFWASGTIPGGFGRLCRSEVM